ncbi:MAG: hypothetical protein U9N51_09065, partial [Bacteroidota bacterium]|nr:hypothetical protein [Bacteroidota bacterium]
MDSKNYNIADVALPLLQFFHSKKNQTNQQKSSKRFTYMTIALSLFLGILLSGNANAQVAELYASGNTTICEGENTTIAVSIEASVGPYTVVYSDGNSNFTVNNYHSDETSDDDITVSPTTTTTYSLVS